MFQNTVATLLDSIRGILSGVDITNEVTSLNQALERALRIMATKIDIPEASGVEPITLYSGVDYYPSPETIFGGSLVDFRPQGDSRGFNDFVYKKGIEYFNRTRHCLRSGYTLTFEYRNGVPVVGVAQNKTMQRIILDAMGDTDGWVAGGSASGLAIDNTVFYQQPGSLRFNLAAAGPQGYLEKTLTNAQDMTAYEGVGVVFLAVYLPSVENVASIGVRIGNGPANYVQVTNTEAFLGVFQAGNWMLVALDLSLATTPAGPVDFSLIDYIRPFVNYTGVAIPNARFGGLWASLPYPHEIFFQSAAVFLPEGSSTPQRTITATSDTIILNDSAYTIYEQEAADAILLNSGGSVSSVLHATIQSVLNGDGKKGGNVGLYNHYSSNNPSGQIRETDNYYLG